ncbi:hypothetical protein [Stygiobacter electus]|uniref:Uncharacterized protein n=1 Tax=Stygiobacter electus TaxID=3032292 RepID=A0AAE3TC48_9BACT|nr:hypothetical protein [Stygiobacter electus]MDF1611116.1 hypothetical protein [Stygiobacter electus]
METFLISERSRTYIFVSFVVTIVILIMEQYGFINRNITYSSVITWYFILALIQEIGALQFRRIGKVKIFPKSIELINEDGIVTSINLTNEMHIIIHDESPILKSSFKLFKTKRLYIFQNEDQIFNKMLIVYKRKNKELEMIIDSWRRDKLLIEYKAT